MWAARKKHLEWLDPWINTGGFTEVGNTEGGADLGENQMFCWVWGASNCPSGGLELSSSLYAQSQHKIGANFKILKRMHKWVALGQVLKNGWDLTLRWRYLGGWDQNKTKLHQNNNPNRKLRRKDWMWYRSGPWALVAADQGFLRLCLLHWAILPRVGEEIWARKKYYVCVKQESKVY